MGTHRLAMYDDLILRTRGEAAEERDQIQLGCVLSFIDAKGNERHVRKISSKHDFWLFLKDLDILPDIRIQLFEYYFPSDPSPVSCTVQLSGKTGTFSEIFAQQALSRV